MSREVAYNFFCLVARMRQAQKNYFRASRSRAKKASSDAKQFLKESKQLEKEVDNIINRTYKKIKQNNHEQQQKTI